ncbi:hypothetical protein Mal52_30430 [Symmachiella dynata]|uniref:Bacterial type II secretion system protein I/J n=1 Tax=Symmachiella dynata TaxID=2527995 RepID=A0A517ZPZ1_9PLAN|nr:type II secretion system protein [Symmachiella dynata]QDU44559.1 hypothetical protein Mal52_30430 [Symmachiella dynata]
MWNGFSKHSARRGLTLIEVVAGIALLSTLLVTILMSYRAHAGQVRAAKQRLRAIEFADQQMAAWMSARRVPGLGKWGESTDGQFTWRIMRGETTAETPYGLQVARLEVQAAPRSKGSTVLASVEFLTPQPRRGTQQ